MNIGGQALIEGILMKSPNYTSIATIKNKKIKVKIEKNSKFVKKYSKIFFLRGIVTLIETLVSGMKALSYSAKEFGEEEISNKDMVWVFLFSFLLSIGLFIILPFYLAKPLTDNIFLFNLIDGIFRVIIFIIYLVLIARMKDIQRVFQYHGAEHMTIACNESKLKLTINNVKKFSTIHERCGTAFIFIVLIISIIVFSLITHESTLVKILYRITLIPVIAGISYEILKLQAKTHSLLLKWMIYPGLWFQKITTKKPNNSQIQVAIKALEALLKKEKHYKSHS
ncbi:MAG: DUF1385 domain-containing protein [Candidatus Woesearchaeota archaeon]|nr:MAG: DUF1385 domain-containing protein [Candidatus Woesearchaeota archaeon]